MENGYHLYDFRGELLREEPIEKFKQWSWRPRPPTLLTKEEQKQVRKNLREYSRIFEQEDAERGASADLAVVEARRRILEEWYERRADVDAIIGEEKDIMGLPEDPVGELLKAKTAELSVIEVEEVEETIEDVIEEHEEVIG
jgi:translation initiation factor 3 subunit B